MLLLDALYINNSGGFRLLDYLVRVLMSRKVEFFLLADIRCIGKFDHCRHLRYMKASLIQRKRFYKIKRNRFSSVFCFGNIPAPIKMDVPVYTYFHNINLLTLAETQSITDIIKSWMKREVFKHFKRNTDYWLVQTSNTASELMDHLCEKPEKVKLMPFYELPEDISKLAKQFHGEDYVFVAVKVPGKGHEELLKAWELLHNKGIDKTLHLTVQEESPFVEKIRELQNRGVKVINHGLVPFREIIRLYGQSKAIIYPSHNESLGLGIVEALTAGCDVIGSNLPYIHSICKPSGVFNPYSADSIAEAVMEYESGKAKKSELKIYNHIDDLIELLLSNE